MTIMLRDALVIQNHRYWLSRIWDSAKPSLLFIGVNPSVANGDIDDQTILKMVGFAQRWGYGGFHVVNLFGRISTDVRYLRYLRLREAVGRDNDYYIRKLVSTADLIVPCWGNRNKLSPMQQRRIEEVCAILRGVSDHIQVLGLTKTGDPKHPLMLGYDTQLMPWVP